MRESRRHPRKSIEGRVEISTNGSTFLGDLRNISEGGLSLTTSIPYEVGYEMLLSVEVSEAVERFNALAKVVWVHPLEAVLHPIGMGLKFLALTEEDYYRLGKILELI